MSTTLIAPEAEVDLPPEAPRAPEEQTEPIAPVAPLCGSALLATAAFAWVAGSVFDGLLPRVVALAAAAFGVGAVFVSTRTRRPSLTQYGGAGAALVIGAVLALTVAGGNANLPGLITEALRGGGLGQPPVAFDPGWRLLLFLSVALLGEATAGLAIALDRPRAAAVLALPFVVGGALLQPPEGEVIATVLALILLVGSLAVSFGADLAAQGAASGSFELRRLARGALALVFLGGALFATAQLGFLFPPPADDELVPPTRPPPPPPTVDRVLFTVSAERAAPWRLGTLDVYDGTAWLTPPFDPSAQVPVSGEIPPGLDGDTRGPLPPAGLTARIELGELTGKTLPGLANPVAVHNGPEVEYDPRTQMLRTAGVRPAPGTTYEVQAAPPPTGDELAAAGPPGDAALPFLEAPPAPAEVTALMADAPPEPFARLQFVRAAYFAQVVAAGAGNPVDVPPRRVVEILSGEEATPYEITAAEVLLARWAGIPARLGYGWFGGEEAGSGSWEIRPKHGATWLEAYFEGSGWVPIVGTPPRAKASTSSAPRNEDPSVRPTDELALLVYVPIELASVRLGYVLARHYFLSALPFLVTGGLALAFYPGLVKMLRRTARRRAAARLGPRARIAAAYGELRDGVTDLRIASPAVSPLDLLARVEPDAEHRELAWLVTRSLWGDLQRDVRADDVEAAEAMARSVLRRLRSAQSGLARVAAVASRASLVSPWTEELPTVWRGVGPRRRTRLAVVVALVVGLAGAVFVTWPREATRPRPPALGGQLVPPEIGGIRIQREQSAEEEFGAADEPVAIDGRVYSLREGDVVQGSLQIVQLDAKFDTRSPEVRDQVLSGLGDGRFRPARVGDEQVFRLAQAEQTLLLSFAPGGHTYVLMAVRPEYADAERLFASVLAFASGERDAELRAPGVPVPDPRRGSPT